MSFILRICRRHHGIRSVAWNHNKHADQNTAEPEDTKKLLETLKIQQHSARPCSDGVFLTCMYLRVQHVHVVLGEEAADACPAVGSCSSAEKLPLSWA